MIAKHQAMEMALLDLIDTIESTGGILINEYGQLVGCVIDPEWSDLADSYLRACDALGRKPKQRVEVAV
jgi:hypothetical protein